MYRNLVSCILLGAVALAPLPACTTVERTGPPPPRVERRPPAPYAKAVWIEGHWKRQHGEWVWAPGYWVKRPAPKSIWVPGHWKKTPWGWKWKPGRWR